jgi:hypothetical protein
MVRGGSYLDLMPTRPLLMLAFFQAHCLFFLMKNVGFGDCLKILYAVSLHKCLLDLSNIQ